MTNSVTVVDYGAGNIGSVLNMYKRLGIPTIRANTPKAIQKASHLLLPGVGAFDHCMHTLNDSGLRDALADAAMNRHIPLLGICVGFQMLFSGSEEGSCAGLGWLNGKVIKFDKQRLSPQDKIPHMGWEEIAFQSSHPLFSNFIQPRFYFVHSFHANPEGETLSLASCRHGYDFCCAASKGNIMGVQFHPEKSHRYGMLLLKNFSEIVI